MKRRVMVSRGCPGFWRVRFERRGEKSGIYMPADVQAKNPWAKPLRQVQAI